MFDEWGFSSNFISCSLIDQSSFYPNTESLAQQCPKENFYLDSTITASALFPTPSSKWQSLEPVPAHDIQNCFLILGDSTFPPGLPLPPNESTIRSHKLQERVPGSQTTSPENDLFENFNSSQSQLSYSSESDNIVSDCLLSENYGTPILPGTQLLSKEMKPQHETYQKFLEAGGILDQLIKTDSSESVFGGLSQPGLCSNGIRTPIIGTLGASRPPSPIPSAAPSHIELNKQLPLADGREISKKSGSSRNDTAKFKRFPCPECGQKFARAFNLQTHIATHAGTRPFSCPADGCFKAFSRRHDLGRHMNAVHHQWLAIQNLSVAEAVRSLHWEKKKNSSNGHRNRAKKSNQT